MTIQEIHSYLEKASASGIRPGLDRMRELMRRLDNPQDRLPVIHVAGTNGKGSTSAYMASILLCAGKRFGWYSSPAVIDERETIRIMDGSRGNSFREMLSSSYVSGAVYASAMSSVIEASEAMVSEGWEMPTAYELETAGAFVILRNERVDVAIIEVGMGGKNDATNIMKKSLLSVVTPIGLDHMQFLGSSIYQIAGEKAGILSENGHLVTYQSGVLMVGTDPRTVRRQERNRGIILGRLRSEAEDKNATMTVVDRDELTVEKKSLSGTDFSFRGESFHTQMCGVYQPGNAALAIEAMRILASVTGWDEVSSSIHDGIAQAVWPARFDIIMQEPLVIYDGAHNTDGATALALTLQSLVPDRRIYAVMGVFKDKAVDDMLSTVLPVIDRIRTVRAPGERGMSAHSLAEHVHFIRPDMPVEIGGDDIREAYDETVRQAKEDGAVVLVFGSLSLAGAVYKKTRLIDRLRGQGRSVQAACGGQGTCGKCVVRVVQGELPVTEADRKRFSDGELEQGYRLACQAEGADGVEVEIPADTGLAPDASELMTDTVHKEEKENSRADEAESSHGPGFLRSARSYGIAVDIGTTTLVSALVRGGSAQLVDIRRSINPQVSFGADVITRIRAAGDGRAEELRCSICEALLADIETILVRNGLGYGQLEHVSIAGNTTMLHLLQGYPAEGLGKHPFTPYSLAAESKRIEDIFGGVADWPLEAGLDRVPVTILPGASAFVGADIVSGVYALDFDKKDTISILIDLGTNGELVIGNKDRMMVTSTAAGPALEGGNLSYGVAGVRGAISEVSILKNEEGAYQALVNTIGSTPGHPEAPIGICGSGVIDTMAELVRHRLVDETGVLVPDFFENGFPLAIGQRGETIAITQDDIREIQMAKAAIRAGLEILIERYGVTADAIDRLYLAGSFGKALKVDRAVTIGLIPSDFSGKTEIVGNTSLAGAIRALSEEDAKERTEALVQRMETLSLATDPGFQERYVSEMDFR